jgi:hypothetical protein
VNLCHRSLLTARQGWRQRLDDPALGDGPVAALETGAPHARYAVVTRRPDNTWSAELRAVAYDWHKAAQQVATNGRPTVARWIATGRA